MSQGTGPHCQARNFSSSLRRGSLELQSQSSVSICAPSRLQLANEPVVGLSNHLQFARRQTGVPEASVSTVQNQDLPDHLVPPHLHASNTTTLLILDFLCISPSAFRILRDNQVVYSAVKRCPSRGLPDLASRSGHEGGLQGSATVPVIAEPRWDSAVSPMPSQVQLLPHTKVQEYIHMLVLVLARVCD